MSDSADLTAASGDINDAYGGVSDVFRALSSPVRSAIVHRLTAGEQTVSALVESLGLAQPLVSQHLRVLRAERLVTTERHGREIAYSLADEHVAHIFLDAYHHTQEQHDDHH